MLKAFKKKIKVWIYLELGFDLRLESFARKMSSTCILFNSGYFKSVLQCAYCLHICTKNMQMLLQTLERGLQWKNFSCNLVPIELGV